jgi:hypothetical protein
MSIIQFILVFGLSVVAQIWLSRKFYVLKCSFQERKEAYIGLLEAYNRASIEKTEETKKNFAYWQMRCELVSPKKVRRALQELIKSNDDIDGKGNTQENMKYIFRKDLGMDI